jgi:dihydrofolate reductase
MITIIAAIAQNNALGKNNDLIWHLPADLKRFKQRTTGHYILMGRNTFESIGRPLPNRTTVIITRNENYAKEGCLIAHSLEDAIEMAKEEEQVFIIGGAQVYENAIENNVADVLDITLVHEAFDADVFFPEIDLNIWKEVAREDFEADEKSKLAYSFVRYEKIVN